MQNNPAICLHTTRLTIFFIVFGYFSLVFIHFMQTQFILSSKQICSILRSKRCVQLTNGNTMVKFIILLKHCVDVKLSWIAFCRLFCLSFYALSSRNTEICVQFEQPVSLIGRQPPYAKLIHEQSDYYWNVNKEENNEWMQAVSCTTSVWKRWFQFNWIQNAMKYTEKMINFLKLSKEKYAPQRMSNSSAV